MAVVFFYHALICIPSVQSGSHCSAAFYDASTNRLSINTAIQRQSAALNAFSAVRIRSTYVHLSLRLVQVRVLPRSNPL